MYYFRDTTAGSSATDDLPAEAMSFNGSYIENLITGYRTLNVEGRESGICEVIETSRAREHGSIYRGKRYPAKNLRVRFKLEAPDAATFESRFTALNGILDAEQAELIFRDEVGVYYIGTKTGISGVKPGQIATTGVIEFRCTDPFKYGTEEKTRSLTAETITVNYAGTQPVRPTINAFLNSNIGYIAYTLNGARIEMGDEDAANPFSGGTARQLAAFSAGEGEIDSVPASPTSGYLSFACTVSFDDDYASGVVDIQLYDGFVDAGAVIISVGTADADGIRTVTFQFYNVTVTFDVDFSTAKRIFFRKENLEITAVVGNQSKQITVEEGAIAGLTISSIIWYTGTSSSISGAVLYEYDTADAMSGLGLHGDTLIIDAQEAEISRSGVDMHGVGSIYNNFEGFMLKPGANTLTVEKSSWASLPLTTVIWREAFV